MILNVKILEAFPLKSEMRQECLPLLLLFKNVSEVLASVTSRTYQNSSKSVRKAKAPQ